jgi:predicted permease
VPLGLATSRRGVTVEGHTRQPGEDMEFDSNIVGPDYFRTMGVPLVRGRDFTADDRAPAQGAPGVCIVNEAFARRFWPGQDALGKRISTSGPKGPFREVVGVVKDGKYRTLGDEALPYFAVPFLQSYEAEMTVIARGGDPRALLAAMRNEVQALDKTLPVTDAKTMTEHLGLALLPARVAGLTLGVFGGLALLLAAVGLYGLISYSVARRTRELGIRMALGARGGDVLRLVIGQGMRLTLVGVAVGLLGAFGVTRLLASMLYGVTPHDPTTYAVVALLLTGVALVACYLPARRATKVDPLIALRYE